MGAIQGIIAQDELHCPGTCFYTYYTGPYKPSDAMENIDRTDGVSTLNE
jgi:hypothetical protein